MSVSASEGQTSGLRLCFSLYPLLESYTEVMRLVEMAQIKRASVSSLMGSVYVFFFFLLTSSSITLLGTPHPKHSLKKSKSSLNETSLILFEPILLSCFTL